MRSNGIFFKSATANASIQITNCQINEIPRRDVFVNYAGGGLFSFTRNQGAAMALIQK